jgi:hypothetical protein
VAPEEVDDCALACGSVFLPASAGDDSDVVCDAFWGIAGSGICATLIDGPRLIKPIAPYMAATIVFCIIIAALKIVRGARQPEGGFLKDWDENILTARQSEQ